MECPLIDRSFTPTPVELNKPLNYKDLGGNEDYVFYDHDDGFGKITRVQFCQQAGRTRDVFRCLNENEWRNCTYYSLCVEKEQEK